MPGLLKNQKQKITRQDRPALTRINTRYLFEQQLTPRTEADKEFHHICREVIACDCHFRIQGSLEQDAVAVLSAAIDSSTVSTTYQNDIEYFNQYYDRIEVIDEVEKIT